MTSNDSMTKPAWVGDWDCHLCYYFFATCIVTHSRQDSVEPVVIIYRSGTSLRSVGAIFYFVFIFPGGSPQTPGLASLEELWNTHYSQTCRPSRAR